MKFKHKETDRNRQEQTGTDRNRQELTGTDRNRQDQKITDRNGMNIQDYLSDIENYCIIIVAS
jgi:hypothetical protein